MFFASEKRIFVKKVLTDDTGSNRVLEMSLDISGVGFVRILRSTIVFRDVCLFVGGFSGFCSECIPPSPPGKKKKTPPSPGGNLQVAVCEKSQARDSGHTAFMMMRFRALPCIMAAVRPWEFGILPNPETSEEKTLQKDAVDSTHQGCLVHFVLHCFSRVFFGVGIFGRIASWGVVLLGG